MLQMTRLCASAALSGDRGCFGASAWKGSLRI